MANIPVEISDDDDGFDWEAAVMEIDVACEASKPSTLFPTESLYQQTSNIQLENDIPCPEKQKRPGTARQSTLDKFISRADQMPFSENPPLSGRGQDGIEGDGRVCNVDIDTEAAKTWIYPVNVPLREYQFSITKTALFSNTLVALPTGLGKTLIAAVVMYNYFRWFPEGKIIFAAPSRPLVVQQIEACHNIVGIPQEWTIDLTGHTSPTERACLWKAKRVFFVTPQVLENDIQSGTCMVKYLVCLVIDEAHKASGNSSYCVAVRELMAVGVQLRILALTATPGSKQQAIQHIIDNLHISSLEYRNESDPDVSKYVHNRTIELKQVSMGQDADEITNLLVDAMRPLVTRLSATGVLLYRDVQILSPINVLDSRNKFRQAPPPDLQHTKYGEIEGYFGVLLTLCHLRKLLSSHGIKQAYDMLDEKLKQGGFARLMSRNEFIGKAKFLMQKNLSHGAPDPKISKMLEVLIDHFKNNDPQSSRIIIFSNFRGSVRDIMDALGKVGGCVKASEFIGQSKGKTSKGQTQKAQQAILEGFRAGRYNVIVATSIGEEGLDIMEVDLVICFDANVSPLRMIQRMGRTGRKHNGRVVVLACEGSELTGYTRKQASGKSIGKHMRNGGMNSFTFHSSPRMIPHIFKPEVQCVEMSIIQFVPRGRKVKDDHPKQAPMFNDKISDAETESIAKYFHPNRENTWRPSLIAFPHFQAFPSRVHKVMHSFKTGLLIDTMQHLQGLSYSSDIKSFFVEDGGSSGQRLGVETVGQHTDDREDSAGLCDSPKAQSERCVLDFEISPRGASKTNGLHEIADLQVSNPIHSYLFGSDFVSVDALGKVLILSVPFLSLKQVSHSKCTSESRTVLKNCLRQNLCTFEVLPGDYKERPSQAKAVGDATISSQITCTKNGNMLTSTLCKSDVQQKEPVDGIERILQIPNMDFQREETLDGIERIPHTPNLEVCVSGQGNNVVGTPGIVENKTPILLADDFCNNFEDTELSPRLTNLIKSGVVPESPIGNGAQIKRSPLMMSEPSLKRMRRQPIFAEKDLNFSELSNREGNNEFLVPGLVSPAKLQTELLLKSSSPRKNEMVVTDSSTCVRAALASPMSDEFHSPLVKMNNSDNATRCISTSPVEEINAPLANLISSSCSKDWHLSFNDKSESVAQAPKFKRLRKHGDIYRRNMESAKENSDVPTEILPRSLARINPIINKLCRGKKKSFDDVRDFIQEEAEVSPNAGVSDDEEDEEPNSHDNSFIDDRINPTAASTQAEGSSIDIMAIYRRSLLSQSPMVSQPDSLTNISPDSVTRITGSGSSSIKTAHSLQTPQTESENQSSGKNSVSHLLNNPSEALPSTTSLSPKNSERMESRKRRLSFNQFGSVPVINLEQDFLLQSETAWKEPEAAKNDDVFDDDEFYAGLDLEALEAQATMCLRSKSEPQRHEKIIEPISKDLDLDLLESPSFDLGI